MADKSVSVRVGVSTPGAESLKALNDQLRQAAAQAGKSIPDPTKGVSEGAKKTEEAVKRLGDAMRQLSRQGSSALPDSTKQMTEELKLTRDAAGRLRDQFGRFAKDVDRSSASVDTLLSRLKALTSATAAAAGFKRVADEAISFESAMTRVRKVVDGTEKDYQALERAIISMSRHLPISQQGLADIAVAAGQMGIALNDIPTFVDLTAKAATAFDLLPSEAGDAFASLSAIFRLNMKDLSDLSDTVNLLGNNTAATERGIIDVLTRVGATGTAVGLTREQMAAFAATTLPLVRGQSERASTALNAMFTRLAGIQGAEPRARQALEQIGLSTSAFAKNLKENADGALKDFFDRVKQFDKQGQLNLFADLFGRENADEILTVSHAFDDYLRNVTLATDQTRAAGSVQKEFEKRMADTHAQLELMKNSLREAAINAGSAFLPTIVSIADAVRDFSLGLAEFAKENPNFVKGLTLAVGAALGLQTAGAALSFLLPGLTAALGAAGAAATAGGGGFAAMSGAAVALGKKLGGLQLAMLGVIALLPALVGEIEKSNQRARVELGSSKDLADAEAGLASIRGEIERLNKAYGDDKSSEAYRANLFLLQQSEQKALDTVKKRRGEQEAADQSEKERAAELARESRRGAGTGDAPKAEGTKDYKPFETGGHGRAKSADDIRRALDTLIQAEIEADRKRIQAENDVLNAELDASLGKRLISQQKYIDDKERLDIKMVDDERTLLLRTRKNIEKALAVPGIKPDEADRLKADLVRLDSEIDVLLDKEKTITIKADLDRAKLAEDIKALKEDLARDIAELTGDTLGATLEQIRQEKERLLTDPRFKDDPGLRAQIERRAALKETQAGFNERKRIADETNSYLQLKEQEYQRQLDAGEISMLERERAVAAARKEAADKLREQIDLMRELAGENPAMLLQVAQLEAQWLSLGKTVDKVALSINQAFAGGFVSAVEAALNGTEKSLTGFLMRIAQATVNSWQQAAGNQLNSLVLKSLGGTGGIGGVLSQFLSGGFPGLGSSLSSMFGGYFANGGDYPAGKFIVVGENGPEVLFPGVSGSVASTNALTSAVQSMAGTQRQGGGASVASYAPAAPVFSPIIRIINEDNPQRAREAMASAEGDSVIRNSMERNQNYMRQLLGVRS